MKQKIRLTFEKVETIRVAAGGQNAYGFCPICCRDVEMAAPHVITTVLGGSEREIFRMVEAGKVYSIESDRLRVCLMCLEDERRKLCEM